MADLSADQRSSAEAAIAKVLMASDVSVLEARPLPDADIKEFFCQHWKTAKTVLEFLSGLLPIWLRPIVAVIIKAGDAAHSAICG